MFDHCSILQEVPRLPRGLDYLEIYGLKRMREIERERDLRMMMMMMPWAYRPIYCNISSALINYVREKREIC